MLYSGVFTALDYFVGAVITQTLTGDPFLFELVGGGKLMRYL